jgi:RNA polymerase sigma-70 factor (ECF subfamily)
MSKAPASPRSTLYKPEPTACDRQVACQLGVRSVTGRRFDTRAAWRDLFTATYPTLAGWVRRLVDDDEIAHEIASEAFTRLMSHWSLPDDPHAYLYKIATNLVHDHWRRTKRERTTLRSIAERQRHERVSAPDSNLNLRALLEPLPRHQRMAVVLHYLAGLPIRDVALAVGRPEGTVKSDLHQARVRLRAELDTSHD